MAKLIFSAITSLDGYIEDEEGNFDWGAPDEEVHSFVNDLERPVGTYLYGRRMYETMVYWETVQALADQPTCVREFTELWQAADKIVYSKSLDGVSSARTRLERTVRPQRDPRDEIHPGTRHHRGWSQPGGAGVQGWARR